MVEEAEEYLRSLGIRQVRVRCHQDLARIEVSPEDRVRFFDVELLDSVTLHLKEAGFRYVALDTEGYRMGKLNKEAG
jgi:pyridinium-3,5-biscarboxylic acid mononucleotide sulfurtransferase